MVCLFQTFSLIFVQAKKLLIIVLTFLEMLSSCHQCNNSDTLQDCMDLK